MHECVPTPVPTVRGLRGRAIGAAALALSFLSATVPVAAAAPLSFPAPVGSPLGWRPYWLVTEQESALFSRADGQDVLAIAPTGTYYRVDAPVAAGRAWVFNPLLNGWGWLPVQGTAPSEAPAPETVDAYFAPPMPDPRGYLYERYPSIAPRMDCVIQYESRWDPLARNPRSTASGLAQFLDATWAGTPQGQAGLSPFEPYASIDAAAWLQQNRGWRQWQVVMVGLC